MVGAMQKGVTVLRGVLEFGIAFRFAILMADKVSGLFAGDFVRADFATHPIRLSEKIAFQGPRTRPITPASLPNLPPDQKFLRTGYFACPPVRLAPVRCYDFGSAVVWRC